MIQHFAKCICQDCDFARKSPRNERAKDRENGGPAGGGGLSEGETITFSGYHAFLQVEPNKPQQLGEILYEGTTVKRYEGTFVPSYTYICGNK